MARSEKVYEGAQVDPKPAQTEDEQEEDEPDMGLVAQPNQKHKGAQTNVRFTMSAASQYYVYMIAVCTESPTQFGAWMGSIQAADW